MLVPALHYRRSDQSPTERECSELLLSRGLPAECLLRNCGKYIGGGGLFGCLCSCNFCCIIVSGCVPVSGSLFAFSPYSSSSRSSIYCLFSHKTVTWCAFPSIVSGGRSNSSNPVSPSWWKSSGLVGDSPSFRISTWEGRGWQ
mmetsp:Transcript_11205/g.23752  ORF Transcript_11205/g.23752 Transcript_11205/m.23752 type:complete len:143 (-) Transcript_11205:509-937(-)